MRLLPLGSLTASLDWLVIALLAPFLLYPEHFSALIVSFVLMAMAGWWLLRSWTTHRVLPHTPLNLPLLCLLIMVPVSLYASANFATSLPRLTALLFGVAVYFLVARACTKTRALLGVLALWYVSAVAIGLLSLVTTDWASKYALLNALTSRLPHLVIGMAETPEGGLHPNEVGGLMALFLPFALSMSFASSHIGYQGLAAQNSVVSRPTFLFHLLDPAQRLGRLSWLILLLLLIGLLIFTQSRSALFGTTVSIVCLGVVRGKHFRWLLLLGIAVSLFVVVVVGPMTVTDALLGGQAIAITGDSLDLASRKEVWSRALYAIQDFPFTGVGLNQFEPVVKLLYPLFLSGSDASFTHAHNLYLQAGVDFGLEGLVAYVAIVVAALAMAFRSYRLLEDGFERSVVLGLAVGLLGQQLAGLSDAAIRIGTKPSFEWWMFLGMIAGIYAQVSAQPSASGVRLRMSRPDVFGLWVLLSLIAIANVGTNAVLGVLLAILGGCAVGLGAIVADSSIHEIAKFSSAALPPRPSGRNSTD